MERILVLNDTKYPAEFSKVDIDPPAGMLKNDFVENRIIQAINQYNPKLDIVKVEYAQIENQFLNFKKGNHNGVIVEEELIDSSHSVRYRRNGYYIYSNAGITKARRIIMYVMLSSPGEPGRNSFVSQTVFPTLLDYIEDSLPTVTYEIADHSFCFINISNKVFTASMILRHVCSFYRLGMQYMEVFANSINTTTIPKDLKKFLQQYSSDFVSCYLLGTDTYEDSNYKIEFKNKKFFIKANDMIAKLNTSGGITDFNGSNEKFYWVEIFPMSIYAYKQGYKIDYQEYEDFVVNYRARFSPTSDKFSRCEILLKYFQKYFI